MVHERVAAVAGPTDAELMGAPDDDGAAFGRLYDRHAAYVLGWCVRRTGDAEIAADITMETFADAYFHRRRFDPSYPSARPWLLGIARHHLKRFNRRQRLSTKYRAKLGVYTTAQLGPDEIEQIERLADLDQLRTTVHAALGSIPGQQAEAVWLRVGLSLSYTEVARRLGCSEGAARVRVTRGLSRLSERLEMP